MRYGQTDRCTLYIVQINNGHTLSHCVSHSKPYESWETATYFFNDLKWSGLKGFKRFIIFDLKTQSECEKRERGKKVKK